MHQPLPIADIEASMLGGENHQILKFTLNITCPFGSQHKHINTDFSLYVFVFECSPYLMITRFTASGFFAV